MTAADPSFSSSADKRSLLARIGHWLVERYGEPGESPTSLTATRVQELLQNSRRRHVVDLIDEYGALAIGELAERVAARETGVDPEQVPSDDRKRVYVGLYQCHLDKLDEADVVEYDKRGGLVEAGPELSGVAGVMHAVEARTGGESA